MKRGGPLRTTPDKARAWRQRSKPLARGSWMKKSSRIKPMSAKRQDFEAELNRVRPVVYKRSGGLCEAQLPGCQGVAGNVHHIGGRTRPDANTPSLLLHCCGACHPEGIHRAHKQEAIARGLLIPWATSSPNKSLSSGPAHPPSGAADARAATGVNPPSPRSHAFPTDQPGCSDTGSAGGGGDLDERQAS